MACGKLSDLLVMAVAARYMKRIKAKGFAVRPHASRAAGVFVWEIPDPKADPLDPIRTVAVRVTAAGPPGSVWVRVALEMADGSKRYDLNNPLILYSLSGDDFVDTYADELSVMVPETLSLA